MTFWTDHRFVVTGGSGFLGRAVVRAMQSRGATQITVPRSAEYDLRDHAAALRLLEDTRPTVIIHLAAWWAASAPTANTRPSSSTTT